MVTEKDLRDLWDALKEVRAAIKHLQEADTAINADYLRRSYESVAERLDVIQKEIDTLKSR